MRLESRFRRPAELKSRDHGPRANVPLNSGCVVLGPAGNGAGRLWQRSERSKVARRELVSERMGAGIHVIEMPVRSPATI